MNRQSVPRQLFWLLCLVVVVLIQVSRCPIEVSSTGDSAVPHDARRPSIEPQDESHGSMIKFVFVMGLEGTGHHLIDVVYNASPAAQRLRQLGIHPNHTRSLGLNLTDDTTFQGLWNAHCTSGIPSHFQTMPKRFRGQQAPSPTKVNPVLEKLKKNYDDISSDRGTKAHMGNHGSRRLQESSDYGPDTTVLLKNVAETMQRINQVALEKQAKPIHQTTFLVNAWLEDSIDGWFSVGQVSYPNQKGECRKLNYANLDLWYQACDLARVDCYHLYLYRDPYAVLRSTSRRGINPTTLGAIHLYLSHLQILYAQLSTHATRTVGCYGVLEANSTWNDSMWAGLSQLMGWKPGDRDFQKYFDSVYRPPSNLSDAQRLAIVPRRFHPYLQSFYHFHRVVVARCHEQAAAQKSFIRTGYWIENW